MRARILIQRTPKILSVCILVSITCLFLYPSQSGHPGGGAPEVGCGVLVPVADDAVEQPHRDRSVLVLPSGTVHAACVPVGLD